MRQLLPVLVFCVSIITAAGQLANAQEVVADSDKLQADARQQMAATLGEGATPEAWDAALFISTQDAIVPLLTQLQGMRLIYPTGEVEVTKLSLMPQVGAIRAQIELVGKLGIEFKEPIDALFFVTGFEEDAATGQTMMVIAPKITQMGTPDFLGQAAQPVIRQLLDLGTVADLERSLTVKVPLPAGFAMSTGVDETFQVPAGTGTIDFRLTSPAATLQAKFRFGVLLTGQGIWALGKVAQAQESAAPVNDLDAALVPYAAPASNLALFVSGKALDPVVQQFNALDQSTRTVDVLATAITGDLFEDKWRDNNLGNGGIRVTLNSAHATVAAGNIAATWSEASSSFAVSLPISIAAEGNIHVHVDPLIGGGAGTDVGVAGGSAFTLSGSAAFQQLGDNGDEGLWLVPDLVCQNVPISIATNGEIKIEGIGIPAPSVGANFTTAIGKNGMPPIPLVTTIPMREALPGLAGGTATTSYAGDAKQLEVSFGGLKTTPSPNGVWLNAGVLTKLVGDSAPNLRERNDLVGAVKAGLDAVRAKCPEGDRIEMLVGGIEIGPENTALVLLRQSFEAAEKEAKRLEEAARDAARKADEERLRLQREAEDALRKADEERLRLQREAEDALRKAEEAAKRLIPKIDFGF